MLRPLCKHCDQRPRAVAYHRYNRIYYRSMCSHCSRKNKKIIPPKPRWNTAGYKKKPTCDKCGFKARYSRQLLVHHVDGNLNNCELRNLKTICLNCTVEVAKNDSLSRVGDLEEDR